MKKRKINRSLLFLILMGVIVTIVAMSVVYAALSTKLLISGSAEVQSSSWELEVKKMDFTEWYGDEYQNICVMGNLICNENIVLQGNGKVIDNPVISGTSITNFKASVMIPGDSVGLAYKITNTGSIPMKLSRVINSDYQITSLNNSTNDVTWANDNINIDVDLQHFDDYDGVTFAINDVLCPGKSLFLVQTVEIPSSVTTIPSGAIEISNIGVSYEFLQTDQYLCE